MTNEKIIAPLNGYFMLFISLILFFGGIAALISLESPWFAFSIFFGVITALGLVLVNPNSSRVLLLFGKYVGTIKKNGLYWVNPLYSKKENFITRQ